MIKQYGNPPVYIVFEKPERGRFGASAEIVVHAPDVAIDPLQQQVLDMVHAIDRYNCYGIEIPGDQEYQKKRAENMLAKAANEKSHESKDEDDEEDADEDNDEDEEDFVEKISAYDTGLLLYALFSLITEDTEQISHEL